jgi:hypothetical protein
MGVEQPGADAARAHREHGGGVHAPRDQLSVGAADEVLLHLEGRVALEGGEHDERATRFAPGERISSRSTGQGHDRKGLMRTR